MPRPLFAIAASFLAIAIAGCGSASSNSGGGGTGGSGGGGGGGTPPVTYTCSVPAASNPTGGGGTAAQLPISSSAYGTGKNSGWTAVAFSQNGPGDAADPEIMSLDPDLVPRAIGKWDIYGILASDYNDAYPAAAEAEGITFIGGTTATVLFTDEPNYSQVVSCDASGNPAPNPTDPGSYRAALAAPAYQQYLIMIGELQIDAGADGIFYDEVNSSYQGANYDGDAGFDDADIADFGGFLCAKYPALTAAQWTSQYGIANADNLNCTLPAATRGRGFLYRQYLARNGWTANGGMGNHSALQLADFAELLRADLPNPGLLAERRHRSARLRPSKIQQGNLHHVERALSLRRFSVRWDLGRQSGRPQPDTR
jgi:hypothetical protein